MRENVIPVDGMVITEDTRLAPGVYALRDGLKIAADGITLEGAGVLLVNPARQQVGIHAENRQGVTIRGIAVSGFYHGLRFDHCRDVVVEGVRVRDTHEIEGIETFLYLWTPVEQAYGAAILLHDVQGGAVRDCDLQHQMNGVLLYNSHGIIIERSNASFNSGWGVYLNGSSDNSIQDNRLDFCNRLFRRPESGAIRVEADAAGIVLVEGSCRNQILRNSCLCGGDGIFITGYNHKGDKRPCDDNLIEDNDCRLSPNNAIESTFCRGNIFRRNDCSRSNYGFWMGYSWDNLIEDNTIDSCRMVGIAIEHGHGFVIRRNRILYNREGVRLFTRGGTVLEHWPEWTVSYDYTLEENLIEQNQIGFNGYTGPEIPLDETSHDFRLQGNTFRSNLTAARFHRVRRALLTGNIFENNRQALLLIEEPDVAWSDNHFDDRSERIVHTTEAAYSAERSGWT